MDGIKTNRKGLIIIALFIVIIAALTLTMTKFQLVSAYPTKPYCGRCHPHDMPTTWISVTVYSETETEITYYVHGSDNYNGEEGWAVFDPEGNNIAHGYNDGYFTLPKDGKTYRVYWVDDANNDPTAPDPAKGGSAYEDITTPVAAIHDIAITGFTAPGTATEGDSVSITVDLENKGDYDESFELNFLVDGSVAETRSVTLAKGATTTEVFTWTAVVGTHVLAAEAVVVNDATPDDNYVETSIDVSPAAEVILADLVRRSAWPEHHHYSIAKDEDSYQTLFGKARNLGTTDTLVAVEFRIYDKETSALVDTIPTTAINIAPGAIVDLSVDWTPAPGKYYVEAQVIYDGDGDGVVETYGAKIKSFSFTVVP